MTVEGTRRSKSPSDGWSGHGDGAPGSAPNVAARREQAAEKEQDRWKGASSHHPRLLSERRGGGSGVRLKRRADEEGRASSRGVRVKSAQRRGIDGSERHGAQPQPPLNVLLAS